MNNVDKSAWQEGRENVSDNNGGGLKYICILSAKKHHRKCT